MYMRQIHTFIERVATEIMGTTCRALLSCCAVALAQHLGINSRFAQQPLRGWLREAKTFFKGNFPIRRGRQKQNGAFCYLPWAFTLFLLRFLLFAVAENKFKGTFQH